MGAPLVDRLARVIAAARKRSALDPVTVATPSLYSAYYLRRALAPAGMFNVNFVRVEDLAERLADESEARPPLSRLHASELVYRVATESSLPRSLEHLRSHPAFHRALHVSFEDLRNAPESVLQRLESAGGVPAAATRLWREYAGHSRRFEDRSDVAARATRRVSTDPRGLSAVLGELVILLVEDPVPQHRPLLEALAGIPGARVLAAVTGEEDADRRVLSLLPHAPVGAARAGASRPRTKLVSVPDPAEEARWVARNVAALASEGTRFGRIAVLYQEYGYGARVEETLRLAGIPVSGPDPSSLAQRAEGRFLAGVLDAFASDFARDSVMAWLTGAPVTSPDGSALHASRWDAVSRKAGLTRGLPNWRDRLPEYARQLENRARRGLETGEIDEPVAAGLRAEADEARALLRFANVLASDAPPPGPASWACYAQWAKRLLNRYMPDRDPTGADGERRERVVSLLQRVGALDSVGGPAPDFERFCAVLREELNRPLRSTRALGRGVFVAPLRDAVGTWFDAVHMLGMAEGRYPWPQREDPLLSDAARRRADPAGEQLQTRSQRIPAARRRYLTALATAPRRFLLWPRSEPGSARPVGPARWFVDAAREASGDPLLQASDLLEHRGEPWLEVVDSAEAALLGGNGSRPADEHDYDLASTARWTLSGRPLTGHFLARDPRGVLGRALRAERARYGGEWTPWDGNLTDERQRRDAAGGPFNPTRLQTWAACPFRYFLGYVLNLTPLERPEEQITISALDRGSLMHAILERFVKRRAESGDRSPRGQRALLLSLAREEFDRTVRQGLTGKQVLWRLERERIERELLRFLADEQARMRETGLRPEHAELRFGLPDAPAPAVDLKLPGGKTVRFRGIVDRVETDAAGNAAVIDYKTGQARHYRGIKSDSVDRGKLLQLPIYALAVRDYLKTAGDVEAAYWFLSETEKTRFLKTTLRASEPRLCEAVSIIASGISGGLFPMRPGAPARGGPNESGAAPFENCRQCEFDRVCPAARDRLWEQKRNDPALTPYRNLAEGDGQ